MTRTFWLGLVAAAAAFLVLVFLGAAITDAGTDTIEASNRSWLAVCAVAGLIAGFVGNRIARHTPAAQLRYAAAITGPGLLALLFALTTTARDPEGLWLALAITLATAALGAFARERAAAQRRR